MRTMRDAKCRKPKWCLSVLRERGRKGLPLTQLYRQMFNKDLYLLAYGNIYSNQGAMTPGASGETADGMSEGKIEEIIGADAVRAVPVRPGPPGLSSRRRTGSSGRWACRHGRTSSSARWSASFWRRTTSRVLGPVARVPERARVSYRTAGDRDTWTGTVWFIEGDISDCFGRLDHEILLGILAEKIDDQRFLRLIRNMLKAGYMEDWEYRDTLSGVPQGGVVSPVLSNIYLNKLDEFIERELIPQYTRGDRRTPNPRLPER